MSGVLRSEETLVGSRRFGELVARAEDPAGELPAYTDQTVRNWVRRSLAEPAKREPIGNGSERLWFRPGDAKAVAGRLTHNGRGGRRRKAGRKPAPPEGPLVDRMAAAELKAEVARRAQAGERVAEPVRVGDLVNLTREELRTLATLAPADGGVTESAMDRAKGLEELIKRRLENEKLAGALIDAAEVERAWVAQLGAVHAQLRGLPQRAAQRLLPVAAPTDAEAGEARDLLLSVGADADAVEKALALLSRPADLGEAMRRAVEAELDAILAELAP